MPVKSEAQRRLMYAALKDPKGVGIPRSVAEKFVGPKAHAKGGEMAESKKMMKKEVAFMEKKGAPKSMIKHEKAEMKAQKPKKFLAGGAAYTPPASRSYGENADLQRIARQQVQQLKSRQAATDPETFKNEMGNLRTQLSDLRSRQSIGMADPAQAARVEQMKGLMGQRQSLRDQIAAQRATPAATTAAQRQAMQGLRGQMSAIREQAQPLREQIRGFSRPGMKSGGEAKYAKGGGIEQRGKTRGRII